MSTTLSTTVAPTKTTCKVTKKSTLMSAKSQNFEETIIVDFNNSILNGVDSSCAENTSMPPKVTKKKLSGSVTTSSVSSSTTTKTKIFASIKEQTEDLQNEDVATVESKQEIATGNGKKKARSKKNRKGETDHKNISVKSSFSKFDALQKRNLIHNPQCDKEINCHLCTKPVYKMEEIKAEKSIYHKNCFRCRECNKQLKVDNYQSHEGVLYCMVHFKLLFYPKCVEESETESPRKPELIVRENQPVELPPDVVRASDKPDLGLEELQQLNVRSKFQVFENAAQTHQEQEKYPEERNPVKHSNSILSKIAKLKAQGISSDLSLKTIGDRQIDSGSDDSSKGNSDISDAEIEGNSNEDDDADLVHSKKRTQRERPVGLGHAMYDIKTRFEKGHIMSKEERREERKQEIQNIRSRLFMGKQARIKEMYQQAVAESEQGFSASDKKLDIEHEGARSLKERFEKGEAFKNSRENSEDNSTNRKALQNEDVFESAISKNSRSIFMELDANVVANRKQLNSPKSPNPQVNKQHMYNIRGQNSENESEDIVKYDEKPEDIKVETSEISSKFKFFETYRPTEQKRREFRITPPREGVVKMPMSESEIEDSNDTDKLEEETHVLEKSHTTAMMLNKFREMEQNSSGKNAGPRPLKCFTPPLDDGNRVYDDENSTDVESQDENEDFDENDDEDYDSSSRIHKCSLDDEALKEAKVAARAKQLRAKFEKWEANEKKRELNEGRTDIYSNELSDNSNIESTKIIRERFENMKNSIQTTQQARSRYQVNRFV